MGQVVQDDQQSSARLKSRPCLSTHGRTQAFVARPDEWRHVFTIRQRPACRRNAVSEQPWW